MLFDNIYLLFFIQIATDPYIEISYQGGLKKYVIIMLFNKLKVETAELGQSQTNIMKIK